ncbi:MAG: hypothetical protein O9323_10850, partial [Microcystis sp. LE19-131.1A]|nr:hypothetical protein [Microcystis sp. LE19-131.1A]
SQLWWVKCILRYISPSEGVERTTKTQRTQRSIDPMSIKLITQNLEEPIDYLVNYYSFLIILTAEA